MIRSIELNQIRYADFPKICRFCLKTNICAPIFKEQGQHQHPEQQDETYSLVDIPNLILTYTTIEVVNFPHKIFFIIVLGRLNITIVVTYKS